MRTFYPPPPASFLVLGLLLLVGCDERLVSDDGTEPADTAVSADGLRLYALRAGEEAPFVCETSVFAADATDVPAAEGHVALRFDEGVAAAARGQTERVTYRLRGSDGAVLRRAVCVVPATDGAKRLLQRKLLLAYTSTGAAKGAAATLLAATFEAEPCADGLCWQERLGASAKALADSLATTTAGDYCGPGPDDDKGPPDDDDLIPGGGSPPNPGGGGGPPPDDGPPVVAAHPSPLVASEALLAARSKPLDGVFDEIINRCPVDPPRSSPTPPGCQGDECPAPRLGPTESKQSILDWHLRCKDMSDDLEKYQQEVEKSYERNLADFLFGGLGWGNVSRFEPKDGLDGYQTWYYDRPGGNRSRFVSLVMEAKLTDSPPFSNRRKTAEALRHIDFLAAERDRYLAEHPGNSLYGAPVYVVVTQNSQDGDRGWLLGTTGSANHQQQILDRAREKGVAVIHMKVARLPGTTYRNVVFRFMNDFPVVHSNNPLMEWIQGDVRVYPNQDMTYETLAEFKLECGLHQNQPGNKPPPGGEIP